MSLVRRFIESQLLQEYRKNYGAVLHALHHLGGSAKSHEVGVAMARKDKNRHPGLVHDQVHGMMYDLLKSGHLGYKRGRYHLTRKGKAHVSLPS
jgi:hypothetical protein